MFQVFEVDKSFLTNTLDIYNCGFRAVKSQFTYFKTLLQFWLFPECNFLSCSAFMKNYFKTHDAWGELIIIHCVLVICKWPKVPFTFADSANKYICTFYFILFIQYITINNIYGNNKILYDSKCIILHRTYNKDQYMVANIYISPCLWIDNILFLYITNIAYSFIYYISRLWSLLRIL